MEVPPHHWLPGLIAGRAFLAPGGPAVTLDYGEVYPFGIMVQISVRFRGPLGLQQQRAISDQGSAYLWNKPALSPQLTVEQDHLGPAPSRILRHQGRSEFWSISYWLDQEIAPSALSMTFRWPEQDINCGFPVPGEEISRALDQATELWSPDPDGYFSY